MNAHRMDQETVERLLDGPVVDPQGGPQPLVLLLTAVRAAPRAGELSGEGAAVHAYRRALAGAPVDLPSRPRQRFTLTAFGVRALVAGIALAATGGVAVAAATGTLPNPLRAPAPASTPPAPLPTASGSPAGGPGASSAPSPGVGDDRPSPSASVVGLCRAYRAEATDNPGRALDNPVFGPLVGAAGGKDRVDGYCDRALADPPGRSRTPSTPADPPGAEPSTRPTERPAPPSPADGRPAVTGDDRPTSGGQDRGLPTGRATR
ncbi:hypothetical protein ACVCAH_22190 [Micromonospora sp. LZ34]